MSLLSQLEKAQNIDISQFDYFLPEDRIAAFPLEQRDKSKLLVYRNGKIQDEVFSDIHSFIPSGTNLILNNSRVVHARLEFEKETGARIEIFCLEPVFPSEYSMIFQTKLQCRWKCLVGNAKRWKSDVLKIVGKINGLEIRLTASIVENVNSEKIVEFNWDTDSVTFSDILTVFGEVPIPPYLNRNACDDDKIRYQTVYSTIEGSVAAPTAGLHFTPAKLGHLESLGFNIQYLTLHVGSGTFRPVTSEISGGHEMHTEHFSVSKSFIENLLNRKAPVIPVGTTSLRAIESIYFIGRNILIGKSEFHVPQWEPYSDDFLPEINVCLDALLKYMDFHKCSFLNATTSIMIVPGYKFKFARGIITNFHQPSSTLLLLIAAFVGNKWKEIYQHALDNNYRFLSYGDSSVLLP